MEPSVIKSISDAGMGLGSLIIMAILFIYQLKTNSKMFDKFGENIDRNTSATNEMTKVLTSMNETNKNMIDAIAFCRMKNLKNNKLCQK